MPSERCDRCGEAMGEPFWCAHCRMWLCRFCVTWGKKCPQCRDTVEG